MNQTSKTNLTIRITDEGRQILEESARRLGLNRSSFIELATSTASKRRFLASAMSWLRAGLLSLLPLMPMSTYPANTSSLRACA